MKSLHGIAAIFLKARNYQWELRRNGEVKLGYWRKILRPRDQKQPYPKRFVLIPGFGDTPLSWQGVVTLLLPVLKLHYDELILFDFPGFGGFLSREKSFPTMDLMRSTVSDTLDSLKPHTIFGHSLGGWLTAYYASLCGEGARPTSNRLNYAGPQLILLGNPSGVFSDLQMREDWESIFRRAMVDGFIALRPHLFASEPAWFRWMTAHFAQFVNREDTIQFMNSFRDDHCVDQVVSQIQSDIWLLWGEKDTLIPASCASTWLENLNPDLKEKHHAVLIKGAGHSPHLEKPAVTAAVIGQILSQKIPHSIGERWWKVL